MVFGSPSCNPCRDLKRDAESLSKVMDIDFRYIDVSVDGAAEDMTGDDRAIFLKALEKAPSKDGVPLIYVKSDCGEVYEQGYSSVEKLCDLLSDIKCGK